MPTMKDEPNRRSYTRSDVYTEDMQDYSHEHRCVFRYEEALKQLIDESNLTYEQAVAIKEKLGDQPIKMETLDQLAARFETAISTYRKSEADFKDRVECSSYIEEPKVDPENPHLNKQDVEQRERAYGQARELYDMFPQAVLPNGTITMVFPSFTIPSSQAKNQEQ